MSEESKPELTGSLLYLDGVSVSFDGYSRATRSSWTCWSGTISWISPRRVAAPRPRGMSSRPH